MIGTARRLTVCIVSVTVSGNAITADFGGRTGSLKDAPPTVYHPANYPAPVYNWAGLYGGVFLGGVTENWSVDFYRNNNHGHADIGSTGLAFGAMLGYNFSLGPNLIVGVDGDLGKARASQANNIFDNDTSYSSIGTFGSLRGRFGYVIDRALIYATAGFAFANITNDIQKGRNAGEEIVFDNKSQNGYVIGGGLEYVLTANLLGRVEYLYSNYGPHRSSIATEISPS